MHQLADIAWLKDSLLFTPSSALLIYLFALDRGLFSRVLSWHPFVYLGDLSAYTFLIHGVTILYLGRVCGHFGLEVSPWFTAAVCLVLTIVCSEIYKRIESGIKRSRSMIRN